MADCTPVCLLVVIRPCPPAQDMRSSFDNIDEGTGGVSGGDNNSPLLPVAVLPDDDVAAGGKDCEVERANMGTD